MLAAAVLVKQVEHQVLLEAVVVVRVETLLLDSEILVQQTLVVAEAAVAQQVVQAAQALSSFGMRSREEI
jgi:hypothetical protein